MSQGSARLGLPFIEPGQIDKSTTHNEALALLDIAVGAAVDGVLVNIPPPSPPEGACYIVGATPQGAWLGHASALAGFTAGGWRFVEATEGLSAVDKVTGNSAIFRAGAWQVGIVRAASLAIDGDQVVAGRLAAVPPPAGGTTVDSEARAAIGAILARLVEHGLIDP